MKDLNKNKQFIFIKDKIFYFIFILLILITARLMPHPPNFSPIIATAIMGPLFFKDRIIGIFVPILALSISDIFLGFHIYQFVVYSSIIIISVFAPMALNNKKIFITAFIASLWFFISTNFAVWLAWDYYPKTATGLIECYTLAIPFFQNTIISTLLFTITILLISNILNKSNLYLKFIILKFK